MRPERSRAGLYISTLRHMKASQAAWRIGKKLGLECGIGVKAHADPGKVRPIKVLPELDLDRDFLSRFDVTALLEDRVTFLHEEAAMDWEGEWNIPGKSPLWNYNLHYFEYLFPLLEEYEKKGDGRCMEKAFSVIRSWIRKNPREKAGPGWAPYTIDLRMTNWLSFYSMAEAYMEEDFRKEMIRSIKEQYEFLSRHVEKDILGNHYFEDLKALVLTSLFFDDRKMLDKSCRALVRECREEILEDGMHFELSPMYHRIVLEGLLRTCAALKACGHPVPELEKKASAMLDAAWSMEEGLERIPLFNDCGGNVAKSLDSLVKACKDLLGKEPVFKSAFPCAGFYIFRRGRWKLIVDVGQAGPSYIPGHAHCDALSFELYEEGRPVITNCGTYAYQTDLRSLFRSTASHNTVMVNHTEQSECWDIFRVARRSRVRVLEAEGSRIRAEMTDQKGQKICRTISLGRELTVTDESPGNTLTGFVHLLKDMEIHFLQGRSRKGSRPYAPEYGLCSQVDTLEYSGSSRIEISIKLD